MLFQRYITKKQCNNHNNACNTGILRNKSEYCDGWNVVKPSPLVFSGNAHIHSQWNATIQLSRCKFHCEAERSLCDRFKSADEFRTNPRLLVSNRTRANVSHVRVMLEFSWINDTNIRSHLSDKFLIREREVSLRTFLGTSNELICSSPVSCRSSVNNIACNCSQISLIPLNDETFVQDHGTAPKADYASRSA